MSFNAAEGHGSDFADRIGSVADYATFPEENSDAVPTEVLTRILARLNDIDARLDVIQAQNTKATEVIEQVGAEVGPIVEKLQGSYLLKVLGGK